MGIFKNIWDWVGNNSHWLFSGAGVIVIIGIFKYIIRLISCKNPQNITMHTRLKNKAVNVGGNVVNSNITTGDQNNISNSSPLN